MGVSVTVSPIRDRHGRMVGASMVARDMSEWKRAEAAVLRAREAAESANRELEAFNSSVAHDLRAPLRGIDGFSQILLEDYSDALDAEGQGYLHRVQEAAKRMGQLIDSLLALGRVTQASLRTQRVDLSALARATAARLTEAEPRRSVEFVIDDGLAEDGDGALLGAAIENVLGNAWKFTRNQLNARIEFGFEDEGGRGAYFVHDNGAGFDMAFVSKLFGVFQRLHSAREYEGTGVGLATVQRGSAACRSAASWMRGVESGGADRVGFGAGGRGWMSGPSAGGRGQRSHATIAMAAPIPKSHRTSSIRSRLRHRGS